MSEVTWDEPRGRVLVVEDDESSAVFVTRVLDRAGFDSAWAIDAEQATTMLADDGYDVLLTDFRLPGRSGLELVREARDLQPGLGIVMMTAFNEGGLEPAARTSGADDFFEKPIAASSLVSRVDRLMKDHGGPPPRGLSVEGDGDSHRSSSMPEQMGLGGLPSGGGGPGPAAADGRSVPATARPITPLRDSPPFPSASADAAGGEEAWARRWANDGSQPFFREVGRPLTVVALWASAAPVVSGMASEMGPVGVPRTSPTSTFSS